MVNNWAKEGYVALILGGSSGLGLAAAKKLAAGGMGICIVHRNSRAEMKDIESEFESIRQTGVSFSSFNMDAGVREKRDEVLAQLQQHKGRFRCLLYSIAKGSLKAIDAPNGEPALDTDDFSLTMEQMAFSLHSWTVAMLGAGLFATDARVLAFTSEGSHRAIRNYAAVSAAKAAMEAIIRSMAMELAPRGIRANAIQAGITPTASMQKIPGSKDMEAFALARNPFGRLTRPEDVANVVSLLCTDEAAWINGAIIPVDGGEQIC